jgi:hypothetical protein
VSALTVPIADSKVADAAARNLMLAPDYLPPCPNCSLRSMPAQAPRFYWARHSGGTMLAACCELSKGSDIIEHPELPVNGLISQDVRKSVMAAELRARTTLANWWKMRRLLAEEDRPCRDVARRDRNRELLALFRERGLTAEMEATK